MGTALYHARSAKRGAAIDFPYRNLDEERGEIRLLTFLPQDEERRENRLLTFLPQVSRRRIHCTLTHRLLASGEPSAARSERFVALSYEWGEAWLGDRIWVDAICIDQKNLVERSRQVQRMRDIYRQARVVYYFLAPDRTLRSHTTAHDFKSRRQRGRDRRPVDEQAADLVECFTRGDFDHEKRHELYRVLADNPEFIPEGQWQGLYQLLTHSFWNRLWIIQEVVLASSGTVLTETQVMSLEGLLTAGQVASHGEHVIRERMESAMRAGGRRFDSTRWNILMSIEHLRRHRPIGPFGRARQAFDAVQLIHMARAAPCADPRDKVYGMLGLLSASLTARIDVDYTLATGDLYVQYAAAILAHANSLDFLRAAGNSHVDPGVPSWVPDLRTLNITLGFGKTSFDNSLENGVAAQIHGSSVFAYGCVVDIIDGVTAVSSSDIGAMRGDTDGKVVQATGPTKELHQYGNMGGLEQALWGCMVAKSSKGRRHRESERLRRSRDELDMEMRFGIANAAYRVLRFFERSGEFLIASRRLDPFLHGEEPESLEVSAAEPSAEIVQRKRNTQEMSDYLKFRRLCFSREGRLGLVPADSRKGDVICELHGLSSLAVLRQLEGGWIFVGECYVHGSTELAVPGVGFDGLWEFEII